MRAARFRSIGPLVSTAFCAGLFTIAVLVVILAPSPLPKRSLGARAT
jgi:hypothetical protein